MVQNAQEDGSEDECVQTDRQAVEDDVFVRRRRGACRQGDRAVVGQAERQALSGRGLEVVGPRGPGGLQVEGLEDKRRRRLFHTPTRVVPA